MLEGSLESGIKKMGGVIGKSGRYPRNNDRSGWTFLSKKVIVVVEFSKHEAPAFIGTRFACWAWEFRIESTRRSKTTKKFKTKNNKVKKNSLNTNHQKVFNRYS